ncbi:MAG: sulfotransferase family protein [Planctomycetaceae bacterium]|nr:sulfotransferase family protein [Planctomycetaceae bacterium]
MITIVSGLPRSGTSLMMQMLAAGGMSLLADDARPPDDHNPRGYFEDRRVMSLERDASWLAAAEGRAVKVVSLLLYNLPTDLQFRVVLMHRDLDEVLRSQECMLTGEADVVPSTAMRDHFQRHLAALNDWLPQQPHIHLMNVEHRDVIAAPHDAAIAVAEFVGHELDVVKMAAVVDPTLYRQRTSATRPARK